MWIVILLFVLVVGFFMLIGWAGLFAWSADAKARKKAISDAPGVLNRTFNGTEHVVYKVNGKTLPYETVVVGATERGYALTNETVDGPGYKTLIFTRG